MKFLYNFIVYSILGFLFETGLFAVLGKDFNSGFTFGPYTIVYGISLAIMFVIFKFVFKHIQNKYTKYIVSFALSFIIISLLEFSGGMFIEKIFGIVYWDYSEYPLTFYKYVNVFVSLFWSIASILIFKFVFPLTNKIFKYIKEWMIITMTALILVDIFFSVISKL